MPTANQRRRTRDAPGRPRGVRGGRAGEGGRASGAGSAGSGGRSGVSRPALTLIRARCILTYSELMWQCEIISPRVILFRHVYKYAREYTTWLATMRPRGATASPAPRPSGPARRPTGTTLSARRCLGHHVARRREDARIPCQNIVWLGQTCTKKDADALLQKDAHPLDCVLTWDASAPACCLDRPSSHCRAGASRPAVRSRAPRHPWVDSRDAAGVSLTGAH